MKTEKLISELRTKWFRWNDAKFLVLELHAANMLQEQSELLKECADAIRNDEKNKPLFNKINALISS